MSLEQLYWMNDTCKIVGVLLSGGLSRRMGGGDKCLQKLAGKKLLSYIINTAFPQVDELILNASGNISRFNEFNLTVVSDTVEGRLGPLAGVLTGLEWSSDNKPGCEWIVTFPTDAPFFPSDLVKRLLNAVESKGADIACASSLGQPHPVFALWPITLASDLRKALIEKNMRKIDKWTAQYNTIEVEWSAEIRDPFFNINCPEDLKRAESFLD